MAIYHTKIGVLSRAAGKSSIKHVAYILRTTIKDERTGITHSNSPTKNGQYVVASGTILPLNAPPEWEDPAVLWNAVEAYNTANNAQVCRTFNIALPAEFAHDTKRLVDLAETLAVNLQCEGMCVTWVIHMNTKVTAAKKGTLNPHLHLACTMNPCDQKGFCAKSGQTGYVVHDEDGAEFIVTSEELKQHPEYEKLYHYAHTDAEVKYMTSDECDEEGGEWVPIRKHPTKRDQRLYVKLGKNARWMTKEEAKIEKAFAKNADESTWSKMNPNDSVDGMHLYVHTLGDGQWMTKAEGDEADIDMIQVSYTPKTYKFDSTTWNNPANAKRWRKDIEMNINDALRWAGHDARVSCLSYEEQGIDKEPTIHEGAAVRRAEEAHREHCKMVGKVYTPCTDRARYNYEVRSRNKQRERQRSLKEYDEVTKRKKEQEKQAKVNKAKKTEQLQRERELRNVSQQRQRQRMEREAAKAVKRAVVKAAKESDDIGVEAVFAE